MTDEERMDRARRIREMRDGTRDDEQADDQHGDDPVPDAGAERETDPDATESEDPATEPESGASDPDAGAVETDADAVEPGSDGDDEGSTMRIPGAEAGDVEVDVEEMARQAGLSSAETRTDESDEGGTGDDTGPVGSVAGVGSDGETESTEETRVLEFTLGDEQYCLDIEYVEEIVKRETVTRVPNTPECVEGVVDLRGQITTILDPKVLLDIDREGTKDLIVVFDPDEFDDQGAVGWVVDDVDRVTPVTEDEVNSSPVDQDHVNGVVDRDGEFVIWTTPELDVEEMAG